MLCASESDNFGNIAIRKLHRTGKGSYFIVSESQGNETKVQLMDEKQAFDFRDCASGIHNQERSEKEMTERKEKDMDYITLAIIIFSGTIAGHLIARAIDRKRRK